MGVNAGARLDRLPFPRFIGVVEIFNAYGVMGVVTMLSSLMTLQIITVGLLGVETKRRPLEELAPGEMDVVAGPVVESRRVQAVE